MDIKQILCIICAISVIVVFCVLAYYYILKIKNTYIFDIVPICLSILSITIHSIIHTYVFWLYVFNWETIFTDSTLASIIALAFLDVATVCFNEGE